MANSNDPKSDVIFQIVTAKDDEILAARTLAQNLSRELESYKHEIISRGNTIHELEKSEESLIARILQLESDAKQQQANREIEIEEHKRQLNIKSLDIQKLHAVIINSSQKGDPYDDEYIVRNFKAIEARIGDLVNRHFSANQEATGWKEYDSVKAMDDRNYFLQAYIATNIHQLYFGTSSHVFGLDAEMWQPQAVFEARLGKYEVSKAEIVKWRVQTIKVAELLAKNGGVNPTWRRPVQLQSNLQAIHERTKVAKDWKKALEALRMLCKLSYELALALRSCSTEIIWSQSAPFNSLEQDDVEIISDYDTAAEKSVARLKKILFGPVYKVVEGNQVLLKPGTVLEG